MQIVKERQDTSLFAPLEKVEISDFAPGAQRVIVCDADGRMYVDEPAAKKLSFQMRGDAGTQKVAVLDEAGDVIEQVSLQLQPRTGLRCNKGPYADLLDALERMIQTQAERQAWVINGKRYNILVCWSRDHVYTLKAAKYFTQDVVSGLDYWLDSQTPSGMFWDCIYPNTEYPAPTWNGEALGEGWFKYDDNMKYCVRRVPVLADTEYCWTEGVWYAWKATGDDAWMAKQLPRLEKALTYMTTDPLRWSKKHQLVKRSFTADEWDFANPHYCAGDHRVIHEGDPTFLFHGNNSGMYAMYWRMAEMYEHLGDTKRGKELREAGEALRKRANDKLFFDTNYGHMIPELMDEKKVYDLVGDERKRMSLSTGYTINRGMPTHEMAVKILKEYQRRRDANKKESFAEWWTMDPTYKPSQWPAQHTNTAGCPEGEYMNGGICPIIAGEIAKAAFDHGMEDYGADILRRTWDLTVRDGGHLYQVYRRQPEKVELPKAKFTHVDLRSIVNRGLKHNATKDVPAWTEEGVNDMRNLPVGKRKFGAIEFDVIDPKKNAGRAVLRIDPNPQVAPVSVTIPVANLKGKTIYFLHTLGHSVAGRSVAGIYDIQYADGTTHRQYIREGQEIGLWWGIHEGGVSRAVARRAWWGPNPEWKTVGMFMYGLSNPHPDKAVTAIRVEALSASGRGGGILLGGISFSDQPLAFEPVIRSYGLPDCWAQAAVYYAIAEGLAGIEDKAPRFENVQISPRFAATEADDCQVTLHYPASNTYCTYSYRHSAKRREITLDLAGSFRVAKVHLMLPSGKAKSVTMNGTVIEFTNTQVEKSRYVDFDIIGIPDEPIRVQY